MPDRRSKRERDFDRIEAVKAHHRQLSSELLRQLLSQQGLGKEGRIAAREVLEERSEPDSASD